MNTPKPERTQRPDESERAIESGSHAASESSAGPELDRREDKRAASASSERRDEAKRADKRSESTERHAAGHEAKAEPSDPQRSDSGAKPSSAKKARGKNNVRKLRMERMMSKAELARRAGLSTLTIDRVERGMACRMDTKRKILEALGLTPLDRVRVFGDDD